MISKWKYFILITCSSSVTLATTGPVAGGYHVDHGDSVVVDAHNIKKVVTNNHISGLAIYVPLTTLIEWQGYIEKYPLGVLVEDVCPDNYNRILAAPPQTTKNFCVSKYEMKNDGGAKSQAAGTPWMSINRADAISACTALGTKYDLISNAQWQTVAKNIESVASNWSGGGIGLGQINRGHSDDMPSMALVADADDSNSCAGTDNLNCKDTSSSDWSQKRTHLLKNGEVIWDFSGNAWEWVKDNYASLGLTNTLASAWQELSSLSESDKLILSSAYSTYNSTQGIGQVYGGSNAVIRGGHWNNKVYAGIFSASLSVTPTDGLIHVGFRCIYNP